MKRLPILALDLATATGWAARDAGGRVTSGVQRFDLGRGESPGMRFLRFRRWVRELLELTGAKVVAFEQPIAGARGFRMGIAIELSGVLSAEAAELGVETTTVAPATLKKHATGKGNAKKAEMILAALTRWPDHFDGRPAPEQDEADALCVLAWAIEQVGEGPTGDEALAKATKDLFQEGS